MQARYKNIDEQWKKDYIFKEMGELFRASKSRFVSKIIKAPNEQERQALQPDNIKSSKDWKELVKEKTSPAFQVIGVSFFYFFYYYFF